MRNSIASWATFTEPMQPLHAKASLQKDKGKKKSVLTLIPVLEKKRPVACVYFWRNVLGFDQVLCIFVGFDERHFGALVRDRVLL